MEVSIISTVQVKDGYITKYKYWAKGSCGCTAKTIERHFDKSPTIEDLIGSI